MRKIIVGNDDHAAAAARQSAVLPKDGVKNRTGKVLDEKEFSYKDIETFLKQKKITMEKINITKAQICGVFWQLPLILHREKEG